MVLFGYAVLAGTRHPPPCVKMCCAVQSVLKISSISVEVTVAGQTIPGVKYWARVCESSTILKLSA